MSKDTATPSGQVVTSLSKVSIAPQAKKVAVPETLAFSQYLVEPYSKVSVFGLYRSAT